MAELLRSFEQPIRHASGVFHARVVGRLAEDGMWVYSAQRAAPQQLLAEQVRHYNRGLRSGFGAGIPDRIPTPPPLDVTGHKVERDIG